VADPNISVIAAQVPRPRRALERGTLTLLKSELRSTERLIYVVNGELDRPTARRAWLAATDRRMIVIETVRDKPERPYSHRYIEVTSAVVEEEVAVIDVPGLRWVPHPATILPGPLWNPQRASFKAMGLSLRGPELELHLQRCAKKRSVQPLAAFIEERSLHEARGPRVELHPLPHGIRLGQESGSEGGGDSGDPGLVGRVFGRWRR
jgi:hypothetical protein